MILGASLSPILFQWKGDYCFSPHFNIRRWASLGFYANYGVRLLFQCLALAYLLLVVKEPERAENKV